MTSQTSNYHRQCAAEEARRAEAAADSGVAEVHPRLSALHQSRAEVEGQDNQPDLPASTSDRIIEF